MLTGTASRLQFAITRAAMKRLKKICCVMSYMIDRKPFPSEIHKKALAPKFIFRRNRNAADLYQYASITLHMTIESHIC